MCNKSVFSVKYINVITNYIIAHKSDFRVPYYSAIPPVPMGLKGYMEHQCTQFYIIQM